MSRNRIPLPKSWPKQVKSAMLSVVSLAGYALTLARATATNSHHPSPSQGSDLERLEQEIALLREEIRIKDDRLSQVTPHRRPQYKPAERLAILELRAARGWSLAQTARAFLVTAETVSAWVCRADDDCKKPLLNLREPVNKFPDFVLYIVQRLRILCPTLGKAKIAQLLARAGLHLGATTVARITAQPPQPPAENSEKATERIVTAKRPNHVWHVDLTTVPTNRGFWTAWLPFSLPQCWPFCWWQVVIIDHFSRRVLGIETFRKQPTSIDVQTALFHAIRRSKAKPKHLISDKGPQFWCDGFKAWCKRRNIRPRFGAIGKHGSIAVVERFIRTLKELLREIVVPLDQKKYELELDLIANWYNEHRPHEFLRGATPNEVFHRQFPGNRKPRFEPRSCWPRGSPCAKPWALVRGRPGAKLELSVEFHDGRRHLPMVTLRRAA